MLSRPLSPRSLGITKTASRGLILMHQLARSTTPSRARQSWKGSATSAAGPSPAARVKFRLNLARRCRLRRRGLLRTRLVPNPSRGTMTTPTSRFSAPQSIA